jgi:hypothetical protein
MDASESTVSPHDGATAPSAEVASMSERVDEAASTEAWLLYGATGRTGTLIAEQAVARGHRPVLSGRSPDRLRRLAGRLDLPWVAGEVTDVGRLIGDARLVLLAAGPFGTTAPPVLQACLDASVYYLDVANEIPVARAVLAAGERARARGITALSAVGFGTVASDGLADSLRTRCRPRPSSTWPSSSPPRGPAPARAPAGRRRSRVADGSGAMVGWSAPAWVPALAGS